MHVKTFALVSVAHLGLLVLWLFPNGSANAVPSWVLSVKPSPNITVLTANAARPTILPSVPESVRPSHHPAIRESVRFWLEPRAAQKIEPPVIKKVAVAAPQIVAAAQKIELPVRKKVALAVPQIVAAAQKIELPAIKKVAVAAPQIVAAAQKIELPVRKKVAASVPQIVAAAPKLPPLPPLLDASDYSLAAITIKDPEPQYVKTPEYEIPNEKSLASEVQAKRAGSILDSIAAPNISGAPVHNGRTLNWKFDWLGAGWGKLLYAPKMQFPASMLQGLKEQTVRIIFQIDTNGKVVSASFAGAGLTAYNWQINSLLLEKVGQFRFATAPPASYAKEASQESTETPPNSSQWLRKGELSFHFSRGAHMQAKQSGQSMTAKSQTGNVTKNAVPIKSAKSVSNKQIDQTVSTANTLKIEMLTPNTKLWRESPSSETTGHNDEENLQTPLQ